MSVADKYIDFVRQEAIEHPEKSWNKMIFGFQANKWRTRLLPKSGLSKGYQKLESMMMSLVADALAREDSYVWSNIFAPCEIMQSMGIRTRSIECLSCYLSGYHLEDQFIDYAQNAGIAPTLCSYHKTFVGGVDSGVVQRRRAGPDRLHRVRRGERGQQPLPAAPDGLGVQYQLE